MSPPQQGQYLQVQRVQVLHGCWTFKHAYFKTCPLKAAKHLDDLFGFENLVSKIYVKTYAYTHILSAVRVVFVKSGMSIHSAIYINFVWISWGPIVENSIQGQADLTWMHLLDDSSVFVLACILVNSPRKWLIFIIKYRIYRIQVSPKKYFVLKKQSLMISASEVRCVYIIPHSILSIPLVSDSVLGIHGGSQAKNSTSKCGVE